MNWRQQCFCHWGKRLLSRKTKCNICGISMFGLVRLCVFNNSNFLNSIECCYVHTSIHWGLGTYQTLIVDIVFFFQIEQIFKRLMDLSMRSLRKNYLSLLWKYSMQEIHLQVSWMQLQLWLLVFSLYFLVLLNRKRRICSRPFHLYVIYRH